MRPFILAACASALFVTGCVSPEVVETKNLGDENLTCSQIRTELAQLDSIRAEADKGKTVSGANVAAGLLFWPALIGNYTNAQQATEAANRRQEILVELGNRKGC